MQKSCFLEKANAIQIQLNHWVVRPVGRGTVKPDDDVWQGVGIEPDASPDWLNIPLHNGDSLVLDFGETLVGRLTLRLTTVTGCNESPLRLRLVFAEFPLEISRRDAVYHGGLSRAWIQDEIVTIDDLPQEFTVPRRFSMRYLYLEVIATPDELVLDDLFFTAQSSGLEKLSAPLNLPERLIQLDQIGIRTLRNCMQTVFEDGPKRDRRLWIGDLRLQAKVNAVTFRNRDLVERSLYLLGSFPREDGMLPACIFERPLPMKSFWYISDYALAVPDLLLDHYHAYGDDQLLLDFVTPALRQFELFRSKMKNGFLQEAFPGWNHIDWDSQLDRCVALGGVYLFGLRRMAEVLRIVERPRDAEEFEREAAFVAQAHLDHCFDVHCGLFVSGQQCQRSYASQIWMILGDVLEPAGASQLLERMLESPDLLKPKSPYLYHHLLEAFVKAKRFDLLAAHLESYWGAMADAGMDTYPEVFCAENPFLSPYGDARINSSCHAWSCSPSYFIRTYAAELLQQIKSSECCGISCS